MYKEENIETALKFIAFEERKLKSYKLDFKSDLILEVIEVIKACKESIKFRKLPYVAY